MKTLKLVCLDPTGYPQLTEGKEYKVYWDSSGGDSGPCCKNDQNEVEKFWNTELVFGLELKRKDFK